MNANKLADAIEICNGCGYNLDAAKVLRQQAEEIEYWKDKFNRAMEMQEVKPAKYTDAWWKEVAEFNKQLKEKVNGNKAEENND
jgi:G:T-mismatch repair DNA endonuclease (very short patch repair protein)